MEDTEDKIEFVDILKPPFFESSGEKKPRGQALSDGDWIGTFNLWVVSKRPEPAILYQQRSLQKTWSPGLLDVVVAGRYRAGETLTDGLREVDEEIGKHYEPQEVLYLGKKIYVGLDTKGRTNNNVIDVYIIEDNSPLGTYRLQEEEVEAICVLPVRELLKVHHDEHYSFRVEALNNKGAKVTLNIKKSSFPQNFDNYHYKMAVLANRFFSGDKDLLY